MAKDDSIEIFLGHLKSGQLDETNQLDDDLSSESDSDEEEIWHEQERSDENEYLLFKK